MNKVVTVDDTVVAQLLNNTQARREFPFLATAHKRLTAAKTGCGSCRRKRRLNQIDYATLRQTLAQLPAEQRTTLKTLLGADQVRITHPLRQGKVVVTKF